jgi:two-component system, OmpR family, KDP operon response regulator KdpE
VSRFSLSLGAHAAKGSGQSNARAGVTPCYVRRRETAGTKVEGAKILVVEDEQEIRRFLRASLSDHGYHLIETQTGRAGLMQAASQQPDLVILDLGLPDIDGLEVIRQLRQWSHMPIIVLSARGRETEKVGALDAGADDYLTKPFSVGELLARMRVALRHAVQLPGEVGDPVFTLDGLCVDLARRQVFVADKEVHLTPIEYRLLTTLTRHAGQVITHRQLLKEVWGPDSVSETHYLRVYMAQLRRKIETDPAQPRFLLTEPGIGYRLASP